MRVQHRLTKEEVREIQRKHQVDAQRMEAEIRREIYQKFMQAIAKNIPTIAQTSEEYLTYTVSGYVLSERDMLNVIKECLEFDGVDKEKMINQINKQLGIHA